MPARFLLFLVLLLCVSLSCNLPGQQLVEDEFQQITSVNISPQSGTGDFKADVTGNASNGRHSLRCYVSTDTGNETKYTQTVSGSLANLGYKTFSFQQSFDFQYFLPGTHALVCLLDDKTGTAWSADFTVTSASEPQAPSSDQTPGGPVEISGTATVMVFPTSSVQPSPCSTPARKVLLTVNPDNSAQLVISYPVPLVDCSADPGNSAELFTFFGAADPAAGTFTIRAPYDSFTIQTRDLAYTAGGLSGTITLTWSKGSLSGQTAYKISMP
jgi:hypothetical protein